MLASQKFRIAILGMVETYTNMLRPILSSKKLKVFKKKTSKGKYASFGL